MAKTMSDTVRDAVGNAARDAVKNVGGRTPAKKVKASPLAGPKGVAAGVGLAAAVPLARKGVRAVRLARLPLKPAKVAEKAATKAGDRVGGKLKDAVSEKVDEAGGAGGIVKDAASGLIPGLGGGDGGGGNGGMPGVGKGRRMPVQQSVDVAVPLEVAYNQFTQFEDWPEFMHRVTRVTQDDECTVSFATKIWGKTKEFEAGIETQRPDQRIKWKVSQGITHSGVVTFHELAPRLTRIELNLDVAPGSLIEKAARGMRHVKRAARADLHRYKAFIEMNEHETGAWRGVIEDGELVEEHDEAYDQEREYADLEEIKDEASRQDGDDDEREEPEAKEPEAEDEAGGEPEKGSARTSARRRTPTRSTPSRANGRSGSATRRKPAGARSSD